MKYQKSQIRPIADYGSPQSRFFFNIFKLNFIKNKSLNRVFLRKLSLPIIAKVDREGFLILRNCKADNEGFLILRKCK